MRDGVLAANPMLFAEGVPNVGAAQLSLMLGLRGACQSIIGTRTAGLDALRLAWLRIASGAADRIVVGAAEESHFSVNNAYVGCGLRSERPSCAPFTGTSGFCATAGGACVVLESETAAASRGAGAYALVEHATSAHGDREELPRTIERLLRAAPAPAQARQVICSANGTWLDRAERRALARAAGDASVGCVYDACGEAFSVTPLLGIAAALLVGELPALADPPRSVPAGSDERPQPHWAGPGERAGLFTVLCSDWAGIASSATLRAQARAGLATDAISR